MPPLAADLRSKLERTVVQARDVAEAGARAALETLAVHHHEPYPHQTAEERRLRNQLRAHARQLGDEQDRRGSLGIDHLVHECAYEQWHRMLFARFLAENDLLIEPSSGVAISLQECEELAKEAGTDLWTHASRYAQKMLPQIFRPDDPVLQVALAREHRVKLEQLLAGLTPSVFKADDALGWVYQFWQSKRKDEVNKSGQKITGETLPAVTQLFTEHYMVLFLLHNTVGAWHAGEVLATNPALADSAGSEENLRKAVALTAAGGYSFDYLRFVRGPDGKGGSWRPAAGAFEGWPKRAAELKVLDPCCGSGHFLVAGFDLLVRLRMHEEGLSLSDAVDAVLRQNLHGLEIDPRCTQIAAFNLAFTAWKLAGFRPLPSLNIACTGLAPRATKQEWLEIAERAASEGGMPVVREDLFETRESLLSDAIKNGLENLYDLFQQAPELGSLIDPRRASGGLYAADYRELEPLLDLALRAESAGDTEHELAVAAHGMARAAAILTSKYTLVITNVPYLARLKHGSALRQWASDHEPDAKADLSTVFLSTALRHVSAAGTVGIVTPQNCLFLTTYRHLRTRLLRECTWNFVVRLGANAFRGMNWWAATTALTIISMGKPGSEHCYAGIDVSVTKDQERKATLLRGASAAPLFVVPQESQLRNPDARIVLETGEVGILLQRYAVGLQGISTADSPRFTRAFWELAWSDPDWRPFQCSFDLTVLFGGREMKLALAELESAKDEIGAAIRGRQAWGRTGVVVRQMRHLPSSLYTGEPFDTNVAVLLPRDPDCLPAVWAFCSSEVFASSVRLVDQKTNVTNATLVKIPFDIAHWQKVAAEKYPHGLPEPESDDPTQWLFHGRPEQSAAPLQVAVARMLGYRWPAELDENMRLSTRARELAKRCDELVRFADADGIVCVPSLRGEDRAADRVAAVLHACGIKPDRDLDEWLRNSFFEEHCKLFHHRPFIWHIWDGRKRDGFQALVNYHKLAEGDGVGRKLLESLTYSYLGDWISRQHDGVKRGEEGAEDRLVAAMELQKRLVAILDGEPPFDIFVRWKPLHQQPIGWEPDVNDGVRLNIRPFLAADLPNGRAGAGVLRWKPNIKWDKDRGKEPERKQSDFPWFWGWDGRMLDFMGGKMFTGERFNGCHYTVATKRQARERAAESTG
ncbi:MAG: N-6 DNA methylase [Acidobacteriota bacterium]